MKKVKLFLEMIRFEHTIFALPFAYMGALLGGVADLGRLPRWEEIGWITLAMAGARSAAMGLNRLIDRHIDAKNPRTANRAIPSGRLGVRETAAFVAVSFALLFLAASQLQPICVRLLPIAVMLLVGYSYTKRFTWACHLVLGLTIGLAPLGGWLAVTGEASLAAFVLYVSVACWIAGFDILYACQDVEFDRREGLYSVPCRFGVARALWIARSLHALTAIGFLLLFAVVRLNVWYLVGMAVAYVLLAYQHWLVRPHDLSRVETASFTLNGVLSVVVFLFTLVDVAVSHG